MLQLARPATIPADLAVMAVEDHLGCQVHAIMRTHAMDRAHLYQTCLVPTRSVLKLKFVLLARLRRLHREKGAAWWDKGASLNRSREQTRRAQADSNTNRTPGVALAREAAMGEMRTSPQTRRGPPLYINERRIQVITLDLSPAYDRSEPNARDARLKIYFALCKGPD